MSQNWRPRVKRLSQFHPLVKTLDDGGRAPPLDRGRGLGSSSAARSDRAGRWCW